MTSQEQLALIRQRLKALAETAQEVSRVWELIRRGNSSPQTGAKEAPYIIIPAVTTDDLDL